MPSLSLTQEYALCAISRDEDAPFGGGNPYFQACLVAGALTELGEAGYVVRDDKDRLAPGRPWDGRLPYLAALHTLIAEAEKPLSTERLADRLIEHDSVFRDLFGDVADSLVAAGVATAVTKPGLLRDKVRYEPDPAAVTAVIEKVRAELLEEGTPADETVSLVTLLDKSSLIGDYFSKVEHGVLKERLKQIRASRQYASTTRVIDNLEDLVAALVIAVFGGGLIATGILG